MIPLLLPHLYTLNYHVSMALPRRVPLRLRIPEVPSSCGALIYPRLPAQPILEPAVGTTHRDINDEVEILVEQRRSVAGLAPRVL